MAKRIKYDIGVKVDIGGDEDCYDVITNNFGRESQARDRNYSDHSTQIKPFHATDLSPPSTSTYRVRSKQVKHVDFMQIFQLQMMQETKERWEEDLHNKAEDRNTMM